MLNSHKIKLYFYLIFFVIIQVFAIIAHQEMQASLFATIFISVFSIIFMFFLLNYLHGAALLVSALCWGTLLVQYFVIYDSYRSNHLFLVEDAWVLQNVKKRMNKNPPTEKIYDLFMKNNVLEIVNKKIAQDSWFTLQDVARYSQYYNRLLTVAYDLDALENSESVLKNPEQRKYIRMLVPMCVGGQKNCEQELDQASQYIKKTTDELKVIFREGSQ